MIHFNNLFLNGVQATDTGTVNHAHLVRVVIALFQTGVLHGFKSGSHRKLGKAVHAAGRLPFHITGRVKMIDFGRHRHTGITGVKMSNGRNAGFRGKNPVQERMKIVT